MITAAHREKVEMTQSLVAKLSKYFVPLILICNCGLDFSREEIRECLLLPLCPFFFFFLPYVC